MRTRRIHLINPKADSLTTRPIYFNRALYSPLAGLLATAALIPKDRYEVVLTDENIEPVDFGLKADLVGISAMTSFVRRGYAIADAFRRRGIPVIMGGVHPSFMPAETLSHADAVVVGEAEYVMPKVLSDLEAGNLKGVYKADRLHTLENMPLPRYDLLKTNRYVNRNFVQTSRGCHHACTFCAEHMMNGLRFRYRPIDEVLREIDACGGRLISLNDADFFGSPSRAKRLMRALKGKNIRWQAGVNSRGAFNDELLDLAAGSGCYMLSIGLESISRDTLKTVHKYQNRPENFEALVKKVQSYGILVFGLFMFGFDHDEPSIFEPTIRFTIDSGLDLCAYSVLTPYPGTIAWFKMMRDNRIVTYDWDKYDQRHLVFKPANLKPRELTSGFLDAYRRFYSVPSILRRFPVTGSRSRLHWSIYNIFFRKARPTDFITDEVETGEPAAAPAMPEHAVIPPVMPERKEWEDLVLRTGPAPVLSPAAGP